MIAAAYSKHRLLSSRSLRFAHRNFLKHIFKRSLSVMGSQVRLSVASFLRQSKTEFKDAVKEGRRITIVIGNQSADLDSMTSAILYAYFRSQAPPEDSFTYTYIPLLNIPAEDVDLRLEFKKIFELTGINSSDLVTLDDLPLTKRLKDDLPPERTRWLLVDHNKLEGELGRVYHHRVHGVIDHHVEEHAVPKDTSPEPRIVEKCGSCTSLVMRYFESAWNSLPNCPEVDAQLAKLALGSIFIDTSYLKDEEKVEAPDLKASDVCNNRIIAAGDQWDPIPFYEVIHSAKKEVGSLPIQGILKKDFKQWTEGNLTLGMSSSVKNLDFLAQKANVVAGHPEPPIDSSAWTAEILKLMDQRSLDLHSVGTSFSVEGEHYRELCIQWRDKASAKAVERFEKEAGEELGLEEKQIDGVTGESRKVWQQHNVAASRKLVGPLIRKAMRGSSYL